MHRAPLGERRCIGTVGPPRTVGARRAPVIGGGFGLGKTRNRQADDGLKLEPVADLVRARRWSKARRERLGRGREARDRYFRDRSPSGLIVSPREDASGYGRRAAGRPPGGGVAFGSSVITTVFAAPACASPPRALFVVRHDAGAARADRRDKFLTDCFKQGVWAQGVSCRYQRSVPEARICAIQHGLRRDDGFQPFKHEMLIETGVFRDNDLERASSGNISDLKWPAEALRRSSRPHATTI
jgi:hypothetical protein